MLSILLPTDFSANAMNAIKYALDFFKNQEVQFYFLNTYRNEFYDHKDLVTRKDFDAVLNTVKSQSQNNLECLLKEINENESNPKHRYHIISAFNTLLEEANEIVDSKNIDLIVMGTQGKSNERHIVFGSQAFQVLKYVQCPVLIIPSAYTNTAPKRILFPTNYLIPYKQRELELVSTLARRNRSEIDVVYISTVKKLSLRQEDNQELIKEALLHNTVDFSIKNGKNITESIASHIQENNIDLLVMVNTQYSFLEDILFPSKLDEISLGLEIPLLALQNTSRK
ncbi:MAG: universal stress protein [Bizionia paragorgiae]|uniref:universal stress protein n=1 Tax=Bizionia paragorgiae TaxID=283786 RepID=UPI003C4A9A80